jgi:hypothetical protein
MSMHKEDYEAWIAAHQTAVHVLIGFVLGFILGVAL